MRDFLWAYEFKSVFNVTIKIPKSDFQDITKRMGNQTQRFLIIN